jgi:hypothetical protein
MDVPSGDKPDPITMIALVVVVALYASIARMLREWERPGWIRYVGRIMSSVLAGGLVGALTWRTWGYDRPWEWLAVIALSAWVGDRVIDGLVLRWTGRNKPPTAGGDI